MTRKHLVSGNGSRACSDSPVTLKLGTIMEMRPKADVKLMTPPPLQCGSGVNAAMLPLSPEVPFI